MKHTNLTYKAMLFAKKAHEAVGQLRKYTGDPYIVHPTAVAELVASVTDDENMIAAGFLHDTLEDTKATPEEIRAAFGDDVLQLVLEMTDVSKPTDGNREARKEIDRLHTAQASPRGKTIKLADMIINGENIAEHDAKFAKFYMPELERLLAVLKEGDKTLLAKARAIVNAYFGGSL